MDTDGEYAFLLIVKIFKKCGHFYLYGGQGMLDICINVN